VYVQLVVKSPTAALGCHVFAVYRWNKTGEVDKAEFVAVSSSSEMEEHIMALLPEAMDDARSVPLDATALERLDHRHYELWHVARERHTEENQRVVEHKSRSLDVSHQGRVRMLEEQLARAENEGIRRMRISQLSNAQRDYEERIAHLRKAAEKAAILASVVVQGTLRVQRGL